MILLLLSSLPILIVLLMLFLLKQSAWKAGLAGFLTAGLLGLGIPSFSLSLADISFPIMQGSLTTLIVAYVLLFGIFLFHLLKESGVINSIATLISSVTANPLRQVILLAIAFSPLVESASGFGIAMVVITPILIALGFPPMKAVLISLVSLTAVPWGTLAMGTVIGANLGNISVQQMGTGSAILSIPTFLYFSCLIIWIAGGIRGVKQMFGEILLVSCALGGSIYLMSRFISVELAGIFGSIVAISVELLILVLIKYKSASLRTPGTQDISTAGEDMGWLAFRTFSPYLFLISLLLLTRAIPVFSSLLQEIMVLELPAYRFSLPFLYSPGFALFLTAIFTIIGFRLQKAMVIRSVKSTLQQVTPVVCSTLFYVSMSEIMSAATMVDIMAQAAAASLGNAFLLLSPFIGAFGGFLTGSNTSSNAMFIKLQVETAEKLGIAPQLFAIGQNTASSHSVMAAPSRVLLAATIGKITGQESDLVKWVSLISLGGITLVAAGLLLLSRLNISVF